MESNKPFCCRVLLAFLILSCFVAQTHGSMMREQRLLHPNKFMLKPYFGVDDTSLFEVIDVVDETNINVLIPQEGSKEKDKIERLPGQPPVNFSQYGGYVTVNKSAGRALYYYFVEAHEHSKDTMPLLLWLNGGPTCSSLGYGAMQELGPFRVHSDGKTLFTNKFSWNSAANVLFLESPAGVGYSYSNTTSDYSKMGDKITATDNYVFLVNWLERYPEYKNRAFYISGESYAGHYVPQLAQTILYNNIKADKIIINLKGIIIGNAVTNYETDEQGMYDYLATHAVVSDRVVSQIQKYCDFSPAANMSDECNVAIGAADGFIFDIDLYNIYAPLCSSPNITFRPKKASIFKFDPCSDNYVYAYMNRPDVQEALHANVTKLTHDWQACSNVITRWLDRPPTIIPLLREFMANALRVWIFSGDVDGAVPVTSTKYSINSMNLTVKTAWHPWFLNKEVGGYTELYEGGLTLATVRDAGHQVPSYQPTRALSLIKHFLDGTPLPGTKRI